ncbi:hypothetical protein KQX54_016227 [Cotesia glomerata]|uniref:Uncharacterized protein n=1 Tax=Cotesia glomerata TaxID=32391 RepID=A0AAV7J4T6_COTGL|nr:hypothetical protein KQX54_016227 [Cotesia glomerata]
MGKRGKRTGLNYQLRKVHAEYTSGKVYHRSLIEWNYWEENPVPRRTLDRFRINPTRPHIKIIEDTVDSVGHFIPIAAIERIRKNQPSLPKE